MSPHSRLGALLLVLGLAWSAVAGYVVLGQLPSAALQLPGQRSAAEHARVVAPQGWAFFTRSAREHREIVWRRSPSGGWEPALLGPHAEARNLWGFDRRSRAQAVDLGILLGAVPAGEWSSCDTGEITRCLGSLTRAVPVANPAPRPLLCGTLGVSRQEPLPWAWAGAAARTRMPATVVRLDVRC
ncbi:SdpA family antimicrobial peptide system protein [Nonomuraea indica]|uniref:SdpA family antimicrobial peptide system protein n=1 Tax=Nonomuraea indica TaxID=1581193 RepID=A0ABW8AAD6_9ACTN|nr:SdpA family antimicrobial peptide system protein [Nonomuraea indica]